MVGIGCGARSYTRELHYSSEFAVGRTGVRSILRDYLEREPESFHFAHHGFELDGEEQRRRFVIQGLMQSEGLSSEGYARRFGSELMDDIPPLAELANSGLAELDGRQLRLTTEGMARSDAIGPWLYSPRVVELMEAFECV
jgi:oxygen-independent coproporphyrinogen-3 oxidase